MRDNRKVKIELLSQWKLEAEFRNFVTHRGFSSIEYLIKPYINAWIGGEPGLWRFSAISNFLQFPANSWHLFPTDPSGTS